MKEGRFVNFGYGRLGTLLMLLAAMIWNGCSKEEFSIVDVPFEELKSSYYVIADNTLEITDDLYDDLIIRKEGEELILKKDPLFDNLTLGSIIVSELNVSQDRLIFREIVSINKTGNNIETVTKPANIVKAFKEYYFNSEFSELISVRSDYDIKTIFSAADNVIDLLASAFIPIPFDPNFIMTGKPSFEAIHPHVAFKYFGCDNPPNCLNGIDTTDVFPKNGIYDDVDDFFPSLNKDINKNGLFTFTLKDFGIETLSATLNIGDLVTGQFANGNPQEIFDAFTNQQVESVANFFPSDLNLKYFPIASFFGVLNLAAVIGPEFGGFTKSASAFFELNATFPNKGDLRLGHLNWNTASSPDFNFDIQLIKKLPDNKTQNVGLSHLVSGGQVNATLGAKGEVGYNFGVGAGAALAIGEPNYAGEAVGALVDISAYLEFKGQIGVKFTDILKTGGGSVDPFGNICTDAGIQFGAKFFFDENVVGTVFEEWFELDIVLPIPSNLLPVDKISFLQFIPGHTNDGLCLGSDGCAVTSQTYFNMAVSDQNTLELEFKHTNQKIPNEKYEVEFVAGPTKYKVDGDFEFDEQIKVSHSTGLLDILEAFNNGTLQVNINSSVLSCSKSFNQTEFGLYFPCENELFDDATGDPPFVVFEDVASIPQYYFLKENAPLHCQKLIKRQMTGEQVLSALNGACINPSGFLIKKNSTFIKVNSHKLYVWIPEESDGKNVLEIEFDATVDGNIVKSTKTKISSNSTYATCLCRS